METHWMLVAVVGVSLAAGAVAAPGTAPGAGWDGAVSWERALAKSAVPSTEASVPALEPAIGGWLSERLSLGLSLSRVRLTANHRPPDRDSRATFLGFLNELDLEDDFALAPVATYWVARYLRASVTWERIKARAFNYNSEDPYGTRSHTDGILEMSGPVVQLELTYPCLDDTLFIHGGGGLFFGFADFKEATFWHLNYQTQAAWEADGRRSTAPRGIYREIRVDDTVGWLATAGISWRPVEHFEVDLGVRKTWLDADSEFGYRYKNRFTSQSSGDFSLDNLAWSLTASFVF